LKLFVRLWKYKRQHKVLSIKVTNELILESQQFILKQVQHECFANELKQLMQNREISANSNLIKLSPIYTEGFIKVGGRLNNSDLDLD